MTPLPADDVTLLDLFRNEVATQSAILSDGLLAVEQDPGNQARLTALMRAAHSLKGAARIVQREAAVRVAHSMEDWFVAAQRGTITLDAPRIDALLAAIDLIKAIAVLDDEDARRRFDEHTAQLHEIQQRLQGAPAEPLPVLPELEAAAAPVASDLGLRVGAAHLDQLLALSGETLVAARWTRRFAGELLRLKRLEAATLRQFELLRDAVEAVATKGIAASEFAAVKNDFARLQAERARAVADFDTFDRNLGNLADRLQREVMDCRMRPFGEGTQAFPRLARDVARSLDKQVRLEIAGEITPVDRMLLERLEAPLGHLVRNAIDHGIESPAERRAAGKPECGVVRMEARTSGGKLLVIVTDDGRGVDLDHIRRAAIARRLVSADVGSALDAAELLEFLFLPGFTLKSSVTDISGRGVGLDVVQTMARQVGASVRIVSRPGAGTEIQLHLPLTLSVVRAIIAEIGNQPYAFPLGRVAGVLQADRDAIESIEGRQHVSFRGERLGLVAARQVLDVDGPPVAHDRLPIVVIGEKHTRVGLVVDRLVGEAELVTRPLDARLSKVKDIAAGALMPDGAPLLVLDVEDLMRSTEKLIAGGAVSRCGDSDNATGVAKHKRVLVVDDSLTVRELERKLLAAAGYQVEVAVDGMDGWNAVRSGDYDLVVTDVDMPRVDGIELVSLIRRDPRLRSTPVMIISYKDRDEDKRRGLEAGADYYLPKASFHDDALVAAVRDLIGAAA